MWALTLVAPRKFAPVEVPTPTLSDLGPGDVLLRALAGGICGSDQPHFRGQSSLFFPDDPDYRKPRRPGFPLHEVVGEVVASKHPDIEIGSRVVGWADNFDALAEYVITSGEGLNPYDPQLKPEVAILLQPLACVMYALGRVPNINGRDVAVIGQGPIGVLFSCVAKSLGARRVIGVDRVDRSDVAASYGVDESVRASSDRWAASLTDADRPQIVIEAVGHQMATLDHAVHAVAVGGFIYYFGVPDDSHYPLPINEFLRKQLTMTSGTTLERRRMLSAANDFLRDNPKLADIYVTDTLSIDSAADAFQLASVPAPGQMKVALTMA